MNPKLIKSFTAAAEVKPYRITAFSDGAKTVATATAATAPFAGIANNLGAGAGQMADLTQVGLAEVEAGGPLKPGDPVMSDAEGRAVKAEKAAGQTVYVAGVVQDVAAIGDIVPMLVAPSPIVG